MKTNTTAPQGFPAEIPLTKGNFKNWSGEIECEDIWIATPKTAAEVLTIVNWAVSAGFKVKAKGFTHTWAPLNLSPQYDDKQQIIFIDTTQYLTQATTDKTSSPAKVTAQTGISMDDLSERLEAAGLGFCAMPAPGDITLGVH